MFKKISNCKGFSLLETLVAFVILSISLGIIYQILGKGTQSLKLSEEYSQAITIAQSKLELHAIEATSNQQQLKGIENSKYKWVSHSYPFSAGNIDKRILRFELRKIMVEVTWESFGQYHHVSLETIKPHQVDS